MESDTSSMLEFPKNLNHKHSKPRVQPLSAPGGSIAILHSPAFSHALMAELAVMMSESEAGRRFEQDYMSALP